MPTYEHGPSESDLLEMAAALASQQTPQVLFYSRLYNDRNSSLDSFENERFGMIRSVPSSQDPDSIMQQMREQVETLHYQAVAQRQRVEQVQQQLVSLSRLEEELRVTIRRIFNVVGQVSANIDPETFFDVPLTIDQTAYFGRLTAHFLEMSQGYIAFPPSYYPQQEDEEQDVDDDE